jgi:probable HAF family extracellular repeat protein
MRDMTMHDFNRVAFCGLMVFCAVSFTRAESYYVKDLGTLGGNSSQAYALNNSGQVVGFSFTSNNASSHAVLYSGTGSNNIDLGNLGGNVNFTSEARNINDSGQIVGNASAPSGYIKAAFFTGTGSNNVDLGNLCDSGGTGSTAWDINNSGIIVGDAQSCAGGDRATHYSGTGSGNVDLGGVGGGITGLAYSVNASGQIVGFATRLDGSQRATLFSGSGSNNVDLGTLGGFNSNAYGINNAGQVVGNSLIAGNGAFHAVLFSGTGNNNIDLGTLGGINSHAYAINNLGEVVGNSYPATNNNSIYHAFIYKNGVMRDVNGLVLSGSGFNNIRLLEAGSRTPGRAINDAGQIAAVGDIGGLTHAILLTPVLRRIGIVRNGNHIVVNFDAVSGKTYRLERTTDLTNPDWQSVPGVADFTAVSIGPAQFIDSSGPNTGKAFYRVRLL